MTPIDVRTARERRGWDQQTLARRSGVDQSLVSKIELGKIANPTWDTVIKLARALRIRPDHLTFGHRAEVA